MNYVKNVFNSSHELFSSLIDGGVQHVFSRRGNDLGAAKKKLSVVKEKCETQRPFMCKYVRLFCVYPFKMFL